MESASQKKFALIEETNTLQIARDESSPSENEKINQITEHFSKIMEVLGLDLTNDSLKDTPMRVAKMYVKEVFSGLNPDNFPAISLFKNTYNYDEMLIEKNIELYSYCEHHFVPFIGKAHVAYYPKDKVIGLSKINRIVKHFAKRPQVQERLTVDIANSLKGILETEDIAVYIEAEHLCVASRGIHDTSSSTVTTQLSGRFSLTENKQAFYAAFRTGQ